MHVHRLLPLLCMVIASGCRAAPQVSKWPAPRQCPPTALPCDDSVNCVERGKWCDGTVDCLDQSDEAYCKKNSWFDADPNGCSDRHFLCDDGRCFPAAAICDGTADCKRQEDEDGCSTVSTPPVAAKKKDTENQEPIETEQGSEEDDPNQIEQSSLDSKENTANYPATRAPCTDAVSTPCPHLQTLCSQLQALCGQMLVQWPCPPPSPCPQQGTQKQPCIAVPTPCPKQGTQKQPCIAGPIPCPEQGSQQQPCIAVPTPCPQQGTQQQPCIAGGHDPPCVPGLKSGSDGKNKKPCPQGQNPCPTPKAPCPTGPSTCTPVASPPSSTTPCGGPTPTPEVLETPSLPKIPLEPVISTPPPTSRPCHVTIPTPPKASNNPECPHTKDPGSKPTNPCQAPCNNQNPNPCINPCTNPCLPPDENPCANPCEEEEPVTEPVVKCPVGRDPCGHLKDRNFNFPEEQYAEFEFEYAEQLQRGKDWLRDSISDYSDWGEDTPRALVTLSLLDHKLFSDFDAAEVGLMKKALQVNLAMEMSSREPMGMERLSQYLNALLATNQDPRDFEGTDLVARLQAMAGETLRGGQRPVHPFVSLSLCLSGVVEEPHAAAHHVVEWLHPPAAPLHHMHQDMQSYAIMALACYATEPRLDAKYRKVIEEATQRLIARIGVDGRFGSKYSTAIAAQALLSVKTRGAWDVARTLLFLSRQEVLETGSYGNLMATYHVLPALAGKSLLHLLNTVCSSKAQPPAPPPTPAPPEPEVDHEIRLSLYVGKKAEAFSTIELLIPKGTDLLAVMKMAESRNSHFRFRYEEIDSKAMIYAISGLPNDAERHQYWHLYVESPPRSERQFLPEPQVLAAGGIQKMFPAEGQHFIFWYKKIEDVNNLD